MGRMNTSSVGAVYVCSQSMMPVMLNSWSTRLSGGVIGAKGQYLSGFLVKVRPNWGSKRADLDGIWGQCTILIKWVLAQLDEDICELP